VIDAVVQEVSLNLSILKMEFVSSVEEIKKSFVA
jgi:hypothetical protein